MNIDILTDAEVSKLKEILASASHIVIVGHKNPDGDAMGSSLAWANYLEHLGKKVTVVMPDACPDYFHWLPGHHLSMRYDRQKDKVKAIFEKADLLCCLDFNAPSRVEDMEPLITGFDGKVLQIDHHLDPSINATLQISRSDMSSTCEMVFNIIHQLGDYDAMSFEAAECIYCGMMTDTGAFAYNSTRPEIYYIISLLLAKGIDKDEIYNRVFHNYSADALRFRGYLICEKMQYMESLHAAYYTVTKEEMRRFNFIKGDLEGVVNEPQQIRGLKLSISMREDTEKDNLVYVSLRSCNGFHCQPMAVEFFNGGGHADASGGKLYCSIEEAEQVAIRAIMAYREKLKG